MKGPFYHRYGSWALITGASSGVGEEFARQLASQGFNLILVARCRNRLASLADELGNRYKIETRVIAVDLSAPDFMGLLRPVFTEVEVGLLINNAGFSVTGEFLATDASIHEQLLNVNCRAPLLLCHELGNQMAMRGRGGIINVSSSVAFRPVPFWSHYAASKAYSLFLGEAMFYELKDRGIDVLTICPGGMKTEFQEIAGISNRGAMPVPPVVRSAIDQLGNRAMWVPGLKMRMMFYWVPKMFPRFVWVPFMGKLLRGLTADELQKKLGEQ